MKRLWSYYKCTLLSVSWGDCTISASVPFCLSRYYEKYFPFWFISYGFVSSGGDMDEFNELDTQDHVINRDTNKNIGSGPTGSIGWVQA